MVEGTASLNSSRGRGELAIRARASEEPSERAVAKETGVLSRNKRACLQ
jgi:hypothetical protein